MSAGEDLERPWYREPFVWMIIGFPALAVVAGVVTLGLAISSYDGLVVDDYYKRGLEINKVLDKEAQASVHGLNLQAAIDKEHGLLIATLTANPEVHLPAQLSGYLMHATRSGHDRSITLTRGADQRYQAGLPPLTPGPWYLRIENAEWRVTQRLFVR